MPFTRFGFRKNWNNEKDFPAVENSEAQVRKDMQALHDEAKDGLNRLMGELEDPNGAASLGARDYNGKDSTMQGSLDALAEEMKNVAKINADSLGSNNIFLDKADETVLAEQYGTGENVPTVHGALRVLGPLAEAKEDLLKTKPLLELEQYMEHWWARRVAAILYEPMVGEPVTDTGEKDEEHLYIVDSTWSASATAEIQYSWGAELSLSGEVVLSNPTTETIRVGAFNDDASFWQGKYVKNNKGIVIYIPEDATVSERKQQTTGGEWRCTANPVCPVTADLPAREWERLHSADRSTYPDEGELDGMEYRYLGVPVDRLIDMMVEEATE